ncbi:phosphate/phosphite/phosphonate ABC transporter substrate-binding protein [Vibrio sp. SCSIO 43137]|uniref:phosphate/phosphite/phosphonate ABC transporter substrate-binding protein n=1 Tax=Vibrio sp. SCSIO 43137 TaxID=3021011 RepID=UPI0023070D50|nr:phosphate/phosphite/phosphonate ABC transporter substrate-binding protein [Vibrio sp. SCSIO 43137]WCE31964.1 phosphate/phosphite/phosphonate ABC transporter substrate-binding protein [Vibrio sp. SCSIO 43137]
MGQRLFLFFALYVCVTLPLQAEQFTFSVVPQQSASKLAKQWSPILTALSQQTGHTFLFATAKDIPTFESRLKQGRYDFAYMNPYHFVEFNRQPGYQAIAKAKDKQIKGIIVVSKESGINSLEQLNGSQLAFPSPAAFAASILTRAHLSENDIDFSPSYVSSHDSVYLSVAKGFFPAGGGVMRTFNAMDPAVKEQLIPIWSTKGYTPHAIAAHPEISEELYLKVQRFFENLHRTEQGKSLLTPLKLKGFTAAQNSDWDDVRALNIDLLSAE